MRLTGYGWPVRSPAPRTRISAGFVAAGLTLLDLSPYALMVMLPALLLAWAVLVGWFTGERAIRAVRRAFVRLRRARRARGAVQIARPRAVAVVRRGGLLLASRLASRPPPLVA